MRYQQRRRKRICYMCDADGVTREHAPPSRFFPEGKKSRLITVRSCELHNHGNSKDVEYVRNLISGSVNANEIGRAIHQDRSLQSYRDSPRLLNQTFSVIEPIFVDGQLSVKVSTESIRFKQVIDAIAYALYFYEFKETFKFTWKLFNDIVVPMADEHDEFVEVERNRHRILCESMVPHLKVGLADQPDVFRYGVYKGEEPYMVFFQFVFYGGVVIYASGEPVLSV